MSGSCRPWPADNRRVPPGTGRGRAKGDAAPFRCLYDNDATNVLMLHPDRRRRGVNPERDLEFSDVLLAASIDETAGTAVDVHKLSPGHAWVPWWRSAQEPPDEEYRWMERQFGVPPDAYGRYILAGGDMVAAFVRLCRRAGQAPFVSLRLNHAQGEGFPRFTPATLRQVNCCRWVYEHPEYQLEEPGRPAGERRCLNWMLPVVRRRFLGFARELCAYDIDGIELDFMRYPCLFRLDRTTAGQRVDAVSDFVRGVRAALDAGARGGRRRWLAVRAPCHLAPWPLVGLDPERLAADGLDMLNLSPTFFTQQQTDLARLRERIPETVAVYLEMADLTDKVYRDGVAFHQTADGQFHTTAHLAFSRGATGVSLFNFAYYRSRGGEPPFHALRRLADPAWLARQPQHWFLARGYGGYDSAGGGLGKMMPGARAMPASPFPFVLEAGQEADLVLDMAPPAGVRRGEGRLRFRARGPLRDCRLVVKLDGAALAATPGAAAPGPTPGDDRPAWRVPASLPADGENRFSVAMVSGRPVELFSLEVIMPGSAGSGEAR